MPDNHRNFSYSLVATAPSPATSGTSLVVSAGQGALFPTPPFNATVWITGANPLTTNAEIIRVTAIATDTLTIVRAQEDSAARTVVIGDQIAATITKQTLTDAETSYPLTAYGLLGSVIKAEPIGISLTNIAGSVNLTLVDAQVRFIAVYLPIAATLTGVKWFQITAGAYTADQYNGVGLYTYSGGTLTLVASSTNDGNIWKTTAVTWGVKAFTSTYDAAAGLYFIGALYNQSGVTTAPIIAGGGNVPSAVTVAADFTNSAKISSTLAAQTGLPSPQVMSGLTGSTNLPYFCLY